MPPRRNAAVKRAVRAAAISGGARMGTPGARYFNRAALASTLRRVFNQLHVNCVFDVGAHEGEYAHFLRACTGYRGRIVSFEPTPELFCTAAARFRRDANWSGRQCALGSTDTMAELHVLQNSVFNSFLLPTPDAERTFGREVLSEKDILVPVHRLDDLFAQCVDGLADPRVFMKMDTQGYDLEVFRGTSGRLAHVVGLQSELSLLALYRGMPSYLDSLSEYAAAGYFLSGMYAVNHDEGGLRLLEVDAVLVRPRSDS